MDAERFDSLRPWRSDDVLRYEEQARRSTALGIALWGKTDDDLHRQLLVPHPQIPPGFELADFRNLLKSILEIAARLSDPKFGWLRSSSAIRSVVAPATTIVIGPERLTTFEARCEILRRAIDYLERH